MQPCKFALKVWNAQQAGATGVRFIHLCWRTHCRTGPLQTSEARACQLCMATPTTSAAAVSQRVCSGVQVINSKCSV